MGFVSAWFFREVGCQWERVVECSEFDFAYGHSTRFEVAAVISQVSTPAILAKKEPDSEHLLCLEPGIYLATTYSHKTYRLTTIGAAAFHFRVRNGTGWFHRALVTRGRSCLIRTGTLGI